MAQQAFSDLFVRCGLNRTEAAVLEKLIGEGPSFASRVAKSCDIKRPTAYAALENLVKAGLVVKDIRRGGTSFSAADAALIPKLLEDEAKKRYESVRQSASRVESMLKQLPKQTPRKIGSYEIRSLQSAAAIIQQLEKALMSGDFVALFNPQCIPDRVLKTTATKYLKSTAISKPHIREIAVSGPHTDYYTSLIGNENHIVKRLPKGTDILSDVILYDGNIVVSHHDAGKELALHIREERLYRTLRTIFELLWQSI